MGHHIPVDEISGGYALKLNIHRTKIKSKYPTLTHDQIDRYLFVATMLPIYKTKDAVRSEILSLAKMDKTICLIHLIELLTKSTLNDKIFIQHNVDALKVSLQMVDNDAIASRLDKLKEAVFMMEWERLVSNANRIAEELEAVIWDHLLSINVESHASVRKPLHELAFQHIYDLSDAVDVTVLSQATVAEGIEKIERWSQIQLELLDPKP